MTPAVPFRATAGAKPVSEPAAVSGASKDFEDFIYLISHDIRNSVRALIEVPQWIVEDLGDAGHRIDGTLAEDIDLLNTHTRRLDRMLNDLLTHSRIGRLQEVVRNDLREAVDLVLVEVRIPKHFRIEIDLQERWLTMGERDLLTMLTALFSNSVRHGDRDTGLIRVTSRREGDDVVLTYCDDGPGIPRELRERALGAMTTLKSRDEVEGSGMGLANVTKIVATYRGELEWLELPGARGVGFVLRFPN